MPMRVTRVRLVMITAAFCFVPDPSSVVDRPCRLHGDHRMPSLSDTPSDTTGSCLSPNESSVFAHAQAMAVRCGTSWHTPRSLAGMSDDPTPPPAAPTDPL